MQAERFVYPVAALDDEAKEILVVYQKSLEEIELWIWNSITKRAVKGLLSTFIPAGVKLLPSGVGFSFIDEGRLRIKNFYKRSPKTIAIYQPISKITDINWISDDAFYFSAQEGSSYNIFSSNTLGEVQRCTASQKIDYLYPCKLNNSVFCITREKGCEFKIVKIKWALCDFDTEDITLELQDVLLTTLQSISYLHMLSEIEGYYLDYSTIRSSIDRQNLEFACCKIYKNETGIWQTESLFNFKVPSSYVIGKERDRLYESITPLLPNYQDPEFIYFVDVQDGQILMLKRYCKKTKVIKEINSFFKGCNQKLLAPLIIKNRIFIGFIMNDENINRMIDIDGSLYIDLPEISATADLE